MPASNSRQLQTILIGDDLVAVMDLLARPDDFIPCPGNSNDMSFKACRSALMAAVANGRTEGSLGSINLKVKTPSERFPFPVKGYDSARQEIKLELYHFSCTTQGNGSGVTIFFSKTEISTAQFPELSVFFYIGAGPHNNHVSYKLDYFHPAFFGFVPNDKTISFPHCIYCDSSTVKSSVDFAKSIGYCLGWAPPLRSKKEREKEELAALAAATEYTAYDLEEENEEVDDCSVHSDDSCESHHPDTDDPERDGKEVETSNPADRNLCQSKWPPPPKRKNNIDDDDDEYQ